MQILRNVGDRSFSQAIRVCLPRLSLTQRGLSFTAPSPHWSERLLDTTVSSVRTAQAVGGMRIPDHSLTVVAGPWTLLSESVSVLSLPLYEPLSTCKLLPSHLALGCSSPSSLGSWGSSLLHYAPWPLLPLRSEIKSLPEMHWFPQTHPSLSWASVQASASNSSQVCTPQPPLQPAMLCSAYGRGALSFSLSEHSGEHSPSVCQVGTARLKA